MHCPFVWTVRSPLVITIDLLYGIDFYKFRNKPLLRASSLFCSEFSHTFCTRMLEYVQQWVSHQVAILRVCSRVPMKPRSSKHRKPRTVNLHTNLQVHPNVASSSWRRFRFFDWSALPTHSPPRYSSWWSKRQCYAFQVLYLPWCSFFHHWRQRSSTGALFDSWWSAHVSSTAKKLIFHFHLAVSSEPKQFSSACGEKLGPTYWINIHVCNAAVQYRTGSRLQVRSRTQASSSLFQHRKVNKCL